MIEVAGIPVVELMDSQSPCLDIVGFDNFEAACQDDRRDYRAWSSSYRLSGRLDERKFHHQAEGLVNRRCDAGLALTV